MPRSNHRTQIIGDRKVTNPRMRTHHLTDRDGAILETIILSHETCGCGYSSACPGVGYVAEGGWSCKRCGQLHTTDASRGQLPEDAPLAPDPDLMRIFDAKVYGGPDSHWLTPEDIEAQYQRLAAAA